MKRTIILMLDSLGIGASADADKFGDVGSNTFGHIAQWCAEGKADEGREGPLYIPNLTKLGLAHACADSVGSFPAGLDESTEVIGAYGYAQEISSGKDTPSGHWEIAGVPVLFDWGYFSDTENSFPQELLEQLVEQADLPGYLGNCHSSGTEILEQLGAEHMASGKPIFYTSADSVFQIACHEETFGLERLLKLCELARELLEPYNIGRVIARPFVGADKSDFARTGNRRDYSVLPPAPTLLDRMAEAGGEVVSVGKIADIYAQQGITKKVKATGLEALFYLTLEQVKQAGDQTIVFTNFVDFDSSWGHRRDVAGYAKGLEYFDTRLPELLEILGEDDIVVLTADHGCDPTAPGTDHTREHIPVIFYGQNVPKGPLGLRETFADIGQSIAAYHDLPKLEYGKSFL
ncbi:phosphopentomutase [Moritella viscosa]|uniref:Phosphopentomutase n=1 Tax=Moritella viscosa TaxID=80854 RepID=A0A1K9ZKC4_9GAMM|nr:phosphopentomutase [Moritella viscosa]SGY98940.1 Phosphopentomutase-Phosphodeoxyribomutase [Moritella viscosa]SHO05590.1 Phosphopentomutase-Phosphodeoxyribomutase [Moritella viscosa]SHO05591.1 Phosphopentomutase-Phosphodeoxyribomutase [Moritella viscosa]SHO08859.1 Phosphopentomutase-Phosphodeoxyribomutase [Moritella viscosa]SHO12812.1 Phosphopentomutase-Phosphodeoxyribomutase [Moritella viscosa]